ncbi:putative f-box domain protein [Erysiphe necator]|uniref:Putative f-box domain protein n=1 Tax=Uncinula necator TaxID=52586 RepID=A0A0B1P5C8_UNCNE|nr:putative f-box domain protein [Erysiphe necator]
MEFNDLIKKLPNELFLEIAENLYFEDLLRARLVCKSWYQSFCGTDICAHVIQKQSPLPLDYYFKRFGLDYAQLDKKMKDDWHRKFMIKRIRREHGIASKIYELNFDLTDVRINQFLYSEGRVAVCYRDRFILEDLYTRKQSIFEFPANTNQRVSSCPFLCGKFLIYSLRENTGGRPNHLLVIWNVITRRQYLIPLVQVIRSSIHHQNQVGMLGTDPGYFRRYLFFFTWDEENGLKTLLRVEYSEAPDEKNVIGSIFFHPIKKDVTFIVLFTRIDNMFDSLKYGTRITVHCFEAGQLIQTQQEMMYTSNKPEEYRTSRFNNNDQIYFFVREPPYGWVESRSRTQLPTRLEPPKKTLDETVYEHLIYDMGKRKFTYFKTHFHQTYSGSLFCHSSLIWNDQILIRARHADEEKLQVITLSKNLTNLWDGSLESSNESRSRPERSSILCGETRSNCRITQFECDDKLSVNSEIRVYGDDNFVVLKAHKMAKVWQFDDLPIQKS